MALLEASRAKKQTIGFFHTVATNITVARNMLVIQALKAKASHLFWIDSDMDFPEYAIDQFLKHDRDIVFANSCTRRPPFRPTAKLLNSESWKLGGLQLAETATHSLTLVRASVYSKLMFPWYLEHYAESDISEENPLGYSSEDETFSERAKREGYDLWCDIEVSKKVGHIGETIYRLEG
jgi:hypothetical protein